MVPFVQESVVTGLLLSLGVISDNWAVYDNYPRLEWRDRSIMFDFALLK